MSIFRRSIHVASKQIYYLLVILSVLVLMAMGAVLWLSSAVEDRKDEVAAWASEQLGYPIEIGSTDLYWLDLVPKLHVNNMQVMQQDHSTPMLALEHIYLGLDLVASFQQREPVLKNASLTGLTIGMTRLESGQFELTGITQKTTSNETMPINWYQWLSLLDRFDLNSILINYTDQLNSHLSGQYQLDHATISHQQNKWHTTTKLMLPGTLGQEVAFSGDLEWSIQNNQIETWQGQLSTDKLLLAALLTQNDWLGLNVEQGIVNANITAKGMGSQVTDVRGEVDIANSTLSAIEKKQAGSPVDIKQVKGTFSWQQDEQDWQIAGQNIFLTINDEQWPVTNFTVKQDSSGFLFAETDYLRLSDLSSIALLSTTLPEEIRQQKPAGDLSFLKLEYDPKQGVRSLAMTLKDFSVLPWQDAPGVTGLTATVDWRDGVATVDLDSHKLTLYPQKWLDEAIFFDSVSGQLRWQQDLNWQVQVSQLHLWNDDLTLQLDGEVKHDNDVTNADLTVKLDQVELNRWQHYVPQKLLDEDFQAWANDAFLAGKVSDGEIRLTGDLAAFPFDKKTNSGRFDMMLNVADVQLHYAPDWPDLMSLTGTITGKNNQLEIQTKQGNIAGFNLVEVDTKIQKYIKGDSILTVDGLLSGTTQQTLDFLQKSPLKQRFGTVADVIIAKGNSDIKLNLTVPLDTPEDAQTNGYVSFKQSELLSPEFPKITLSDVTGNLHFTNNGVSGEDFSAVLLEQAVNIAIGTKQTETVIDVKGQVAAENVNKVWPNALPNFISGQTSYQAKLSVREKTLGEFEVDVSVNSELQGIDIAAPLPLGKTKEQRIPLAFSVEHLEDGLAYSSHYGQTLNALVMPSDESNWRGEIRFGTGKAVLPDTGMIIKGQLEQISIDDWSSWQQEQAMENGQSILGYIDIVSMNIGQIDVYDQEITGLAFTAARAAQDWRISLHSDQVKGNINWPHDFESATTLTMDFEYVYLQQFEQDKTEQAKTKELNKTTTLWPSINFHTSQLKIDEMKFGEINLQATRHENSWVVDAAILKSETINATVKGQWQQFSTGDQSHFKLNASSDDFRGLLADLGYQQVMEADKVDIRVDLSWPNSPVNFSRSTSVGQFTLDVGKGTLIEIEPGAAGRIFGLLSVATIPRRLALDFTDLFGKGFSFDSINGSFGIDNGIAYTDDLSMKGQSATIDVVGPANLVDKTYDQTIKVTPNVSSTLPVAGAVAGGPVGLAVGTGILIVDKLAGKLFGHEIVNLISYSYKLTGAWEDPQLNIVKPLSN